MGRNDEELLAQAEAKGYQRGANKEKDEIRDRHKHVDKTKRNHETALARYVLWNLRWNSKGMWEDHARRGLPAPDNATVRGHCLGQGANAPDLSTTKDFIRFLATTSVGKIAKLPTVDSVKIYAEWFFAGFTRVTGTQTVLEDRTEVYKFISHDLVQEGLVIEASRPKHNFSWRDLNRLLVTLWTVDDAMFIPERYRIQYTLIIRIYCWTGARLSAFFTGGFRYRDIDLVLQRDDTGRWRLIYEVKQRWVKNNRDPENTYFGAAGKGHDKFVYNDAAFFLTFAIADNALFGLHSLEDVWDMEIPPGQDQLPLRFKDDALNRPILRNCTQADGVTDEPMSKSAFLTIHRSAMKNAGYLDGDTIHGIRRGLGKKVDEKYTEVQRSQHLTQSDTRVFGASYVARCSAVAGMGAFLEDEPDNDHRHVDYFQSLEKFREPGLPCDLPARLKAVLKSDPGLIEREDKIQALEHKEKASFASLDEAKRRRNRYYTTLCRTSLRRYQEEWVQDRRDWKILTRGKERPRDLCKTDVVQILCRLIPERGPLALVMASNEPLSSAATWQAMSDLHSLCTRDLSVTYLPGLEPSEGACPVKCCALNLDRLRKTDRNRHLLACVRREMASQHGVLQTHVHYCYHCFTWVIGGEWDSHCQSHLSTMTSKRRGTITYCYTLVRPAYCSDCLGNEGLLAHQRMESRSRDQASWTHMCNHMEGYEWPRPCPDLVCVREAASRNDAAPHFEDQEDFRFHLIDEHGYSRTLPRGLTCSDPPRRRSGGNPASTANGTRRPNRKRTLSSRDGSLAPISDQDSGLMSAESFLSPPNPKKRTRETTPTISPPLLSKFAQGHDECSITLRSDQAALTPALIDPILESEHRHYHRMSAYDAFDSLKDEASGPYIDIDTLFSQYVRSPSPSPSPKLQTLVAENEDTSSPDRLAEPASGSGSDNDILCREKRHASPVRLRIRLRLSAPKPERSQQPRIVLRIKPPKREGKRGRRGKQT